MHRVSIEIALRTTTDSMRFHWVEKKYHHSSGSTFYIENMPIIQNRHQAVHKTNKYAKQRIRFHQ